MLKNGRERNNFEFMIMVWHFDGRNGYLEFEQRLSQLKS